MARKYRVKRYYGKDIGSYRAKPHPLTIALVVAVLVGLGFLGTIIYRPVYDFIMNIGKQGEEVVSVPESLAPESTDGPSSAYEPESEPEPEPETVMHDKLRAIYVPHETVSDEARLREFLDGLSGTNINAVMIDVKNAAGEVLFKSSNQKAAEWDVIAPDAVDLNALSANLKDKGLSLVARMSVFRDPLAAGRGKKDYAIGYRGEPDALWLDNSAANGGKPWLNPYSELTQRYIDEIAEEVTGSGVDMLVLENLRFPDNSSTYAVFNADETEPELTRSQILKDTLERITSITQQKGVRIATFYTSLEPTLVENEQNRYGGSMLDIPDKTLVLDVRPALFGGDYAEAGLQIVSPLEDPAGTVTSSLNYVMAGVSPGLEIIPYIQGGNVEKFNANRQYGKTEIDAQIKAAEDLGFEEYFLYSADGVYFIR